MTKGGLLQIRVAEHVRGNAAAHWSVPKKKKKVRNSRHCSSTTNGKWAKQVALETRAVPEGKKEKEHSAYRQDRIRAPSKLVLIEDKILKRASLEG